MVLTVFLLTAVLARFCISSLEVTGNLAIIFLKTKEKHNCAQLCLGNLILTAFLTFSIALFGSAKSKY